MMRTKYTQSARELAIRAYKVNIFLFSWNCFKYRTQIGNFSADFAM